MTKEEILKALAEMGPEEQEAIREEILMLGYDTPEAGSAMATCIEIMKEIRDGKDPVQVCRDMIEPRDLDFNTCYACIAGTTKHVGTSFVLPEHVDEASKI